MRWDEGRKEEMEGLGGKTRTRKRRESWRGSEGKRKRKEEGNIKDKEGRQFLNPVPRAASTTHQRSDRWLIRRPERTENMIS